jgi:cytochrome P450
VTGYSTAGAVQHGRSEQLVIALADESRDAYAHLDALRADQAVLHLDEPGATWLVLGYDACRRALMNDALSLDVPGHRVRERDAVGRRQMPLEWFDGGPLVGDAKHAAAVRRFASTVFSPAGVREFEATIAAAIERVVSGLGERPVIDLYHDFGVAVASEVLFELFGLPDDARESFLGHARTFVKLGDPFRTLTEAAAINRAIANFRRLAEHRMADPAARDAGPLLRCLLQDVDALDADRKRACDELVRLLIQVMAAGVHTVASALATVVLTYLSFDEARSSYPDDHGERLGWMVEALRWRTFVLFLVRMASATVPLDSGHVAKPGDVVWLSPAAANRDPATFTDPGRFDATRDTSPALLFGLGRHYCLGASLAKTELHIATERFIEAFPGAALVGGKTWSSSDVFTRTPNGRIALRAG